jgi:DNA repair protein RadC
MSKSFTIHDLPKEERPRERLVKFGEQAFVFIETKEKRPSS